ncbi:hypothetical protein [Psychromonas sp.]|uniref:hypothetical protein n=1 Tax=Psychromonas sp. TaxID=1884585 RepID=UPI00356885D6
MSILYSQFKQFNETLNKTRQPMTTSRKFLLGISAAVVLFTSFFVALFFMAMSLVMLPFAAIRLWLFKKKIQENINSNNYYSDTEFGKESDNSVIEAEFEVVDDGKDKR